MLRIIIALLFISTIVAAQPPKGEIKEFTGTVKAFKPGFGLAYERLILDITGTEEHFVFQPKYGKAIFEYVKIGDQITLQAKVFAEINERIKNMSEVVRKSFKRDIILSIKVRDHLIELPETKQFYETGKPMTKDLFETFLDIRVKGEYMEGNHQIGLLFDDGLAAYNWFRQKEKIEVGDIVSFRGHKFPDDDGFVYPIPGIKTVYFFGPLKKVEGTIKSLLFKQNYVCIGMTVRTRKGEIRMGFPSNYGSRIQQLALENQSMIFYCGDFPENEPLSPPSLHAIIHENDTLKVSEYGSFGGTDISHDHKPASIKGKVTNVNRSDKGRVLSIIIGNDCYVEVDHVMEKQLGNFFKKGQLMEISGDERIKAKGEIYSKDYRIITPKSITIDGKNFLLGQQP